MLNSPCCKYQPGGVFADNLVALPGGGTEALHAAGVEACKHGLRDLWGQYFQQPAPF